MFNFINRAHFNKVQILYNLILAYRHQTCCNEQIQRIFVFNLLRGIQELNKNSEILLEIFFCDFA